MGCVQSSNANPVVGERRRLSVLKNPEIPGAETGRDSSALSNAIGRVETLLELLPDEDNMGEKLVRFSLVGQQAGCTQKGFEDKSRALACSNIDKNTLNTAEFGVGFACKKGLKPESPNQDDFFVMQVDSVCGVYGVFDGHGPYGHELSHFAHQLLPAYFMKSEHFKSNPMEALKQAFIKTHSQAIKAQEKNLFDCTLSGTTGTVVYVNNHDNSLYIGHVGDSRAIMGVESDNKSISVVALCQDHKPSLPEEKARITNAGGQVRCLNGDINDRVFVKGKLYPGLAMSRSIGDLVGASAGVTAVPDVAKFDLTDKSRFICICSDGVWEFMSNEEVCDMIAKYGPEKAMEAAESVAAEAWKRWIEVEGNVVDDITVVLVYMNVQKVVAVGKAEKAGGKGEVEPKAITEVDYTPVTPGEEPEKEPTEAPKKEEA